MARVYQPKPCRRCGGNKGPKSAGHSQWYCAPCAIEARREYWRKNMPWWCGACDSPHYCVTCARTKRERMIAACANRKERSKSSYFRPKDAPRYWQGRSHATVQSAIKRGLLPSLKSGEYACTDCGGIAHEYDHRDYGRPLDVEPVCRSCNKQRGTAIWPTADRYQFAKFGPAPAQQGEAVLQKAS